MWSEDNFQYAVENTAVVLAPEGRIATFGQTSFRFYVITELMDRVDEIRVRDGRIEAERPQIVTPSHHLRSLLDGFGDKAAQFLEGLRQHAGNVAFLRYGFQVRKTQVREKVIHDSMESVVAKTKTRVEQQEEAMTAVIQGVEDAWEVCLLKFTIDLVEKSAGPNMGDLRRGGLL